MLHCLYVLIWPSSYAVSFLRVHDLLSGGRANRRCREFGIPIPLAPVDLAIGHVTRAPPRCSRQCRPPPLAADRFAGERSGWW